MLLGSFNPAIVTPAWLAGKNLIRQEEADNAKVSVIHPDISAFVVDWLTLQVERERLIAQTSNPATYLALRDFILGLFQLLEHTPVTKLGIHHLMHYEMPSLERWHAFGHFVVPKAPWNAILDSPGTKSVVVGGKRAGSEASTVTIKIEPSLRVRPGVYIEVNEEFAPPPNVDPLTGVLQHLRASWQEVIANAKRSADHLLQHPY